MTPAQKTRRGCQTRREIHIACERPSMRYFREMLAISVLEKEALAYHRRGDVQASANDKNRAARDGTTVECWPNGFCASAL